MDITARISELLREQGKEQKDLCDFLGVSPSVYSDWKSGKSKSVKQYIDRIADFLGCTPDYLLGAEAAFSPAEIQLISEYRLLSDEGKEVVRYVTGAAKALEKKDTILVFSSSRDGGAPGYIEITREEANRLLNLPGEEEEE